MAAVIDKSGNSGGQLLGAKYVDGTQTTINRTISQANGPWGNTTPQFIGELIVNTADKWTYRAFGLANTAWEQIQRSNCNE